MNDEAIRPTRFVAYVGSCFSVGYDLELVDQALLVRYGERPHLNSARICPSAEEWEAFRRSLDELNVWCWRSDYPNPGVLDGAQWCVEIEYQDRSLRSHEENNFPGRDGIPSREAGEPFRSFAAAVKKLLRNMPAA